MDLSNEDSEKALLVQLADRNLISDELLQTKFGLDPDIEKNRLNRESRERESDRMVKKSGPWFDPQLDNSLKKIALQTGIVAPSQVGLELEKKKSGEKNATELKTQSIPGLSGKPTKLANDSPESLSGQPGQGRPKNSTDQQKRKTKVFSPQTGAGLMFWAAKAQDKINEIINPILLNFYNKKNLRSLSAIETKEAEEIKTKILFSLKPFEKMTDDTILYSFASIDSKENHIKYSGYANWIKQIASELNEPLSVEDQKQAKASFYYMVYNNTL
jgi:hypothetical protein